MKLAAFILSICALFLVSSPALAQKRVALVIGNSAYQYSPSLGNPANDARLIAKVLQESGFEVNLQTDLGFKKMKRALRNFTRKIKAMGKETIGLVYFAGHGTQVNGRNFLLPVDANIENEGDVSIETIDAQGLLSGLNHAGNQLNIIILDACRNNPFKRGSRASVRGFSRMDAPTGSLIAYSTQPGNVALDGEGVNSPYALALSKAMREPGIMIESVFKKARQVVRNKTASKQIPWEESSLFGDFYFRKAQPAPTVPRTGNSSGGSAMILADTAFWNSIKDSNLPSAYQSYLTTFPYGLFQPLAKMRMKTLQSQQQKLATLKKSNNTTYRTGHREPSSIHRKNCLENIYQGRSQNTCVSSYLPGQKGNQYGIASMLDQSNYTAWIEGKRDHGIGEWILTEFGQAERVTAIFIRNGYNKTKKLFFLNSRVRNAVLSFSNGNRKVITLKDVPGLQKITFSRPVNSRWVKFRIGSIYRGSKYRDTALNEFQVITEGMQE